MPERLKAFPIKLGIKKGYSPTPLLFNILLEVLSLSNNQKCEACRLRKEEVKLLLFTDDMIVYIKIPKESTKKVLELKSEFSKITG